LEVKGAQYALMALDKLRSDGVVATLAIAGEGPYLSELKDLVSRLDLSQQVHWLGQVPNSALRQVYNSAKVTLVPAFSRDGVATTLLESAACGVPSISTLGSSMAEIIKDGVSGVLVPPRDVEALSDAMNKLLLDSQTRTALGNQAYQQILASWSWMARIKDLEKIYFEINESEVAR
jgi:glycosyltransferase involved in cell wall biosynthesis